MRDQDKEMEMPTTLGETSDCQPSSATQTHTLIFNDPPQTSQRHSHLYPLLATTQSQKPSTATKG
ncbi:unnamed protein product [Lupinus luteus]|uniref:Uncharacterized protein n=1 Tax=Lupinus luteus TaxID=3873 RepID=A0AAV1WZ71_LUPLU